MLAARAHLLVEGRSQHLASVSVSLDGNGCYEFLRGLRAHRGSGERGVAFDAHARERAWWRAELPRGGKRAAERFGACGVDGKAVAAVGEEQHSDARGVLHRRRERAAAEADHVHHRLACALLARAVPAGELLPAAPRPNAHAAVATARH